MNSSIIVAHRGFAEYLKSCLLKARQYNPTTPIILIGDAENRCLLDIMPDLIHIIPDPDDPDILSFTKNYKHRSTEKASFELICFLRWFFVRDVMKRYNIKRCLHIDSDVLLFCDVWQAGEIFQQYGMTLASWGDTNYLMGHTCYINDFYLLDKFCNMLIDHFSNPEKVRLLDELYEVLRKKKEYAAISDMSLLKLFAATNPKSIGNVSDIINDSTFDNRLSSCEGGYVANSRLFKKEMKKIFFKNRIPYCRNKTLQKNIRFHSIHFHGNMKYMMKYFFLERVNYYGDILFERIKLKFRALFR